MFSKFDIRVSYKIYIIRPKPDWKHSGRLETFKQILAWISSQSTQLRGLTSVIRFDQIENFQSSSCKYNKEKQHGRFDLHTQSASCKKGINFNELPWHRVLKEAKVRLVVLLSNEVERKQNKGIFLSFRDPELMKNAGKYVQIDNTDIPCAERDS